MENDTVAETRLLEKYKNLSFHDPDKDVLFKVHPENMHYYRRNKKKGIDGGWAVIGVDDDDDNEPWTISQMLCDLIADTPQPKGVMIMRQNEC